MKRSSMGFAVEILSLLAACGGDDSQDDNGTKGSAQVTAEDCGMNTIGIPGAARSGM